MDPTGGSPAQLELTLDERVVASAQRGRLAVAATSERLVGLRAGERVFSELGYRVDERADPPTALRVEAQVAVVTLGRRAAALTTHSAGWFSVEFAPGERLERLESADRIAVLVTNRRALGISAQRGDFVALELGTAEAIESVAAADGALTVVTERRVLMLAEGGSRWTTLRRKKR